MSKKLLHISHHIGCLRDQQYILEHLGFEITNYKFTDNVFTITKDIADEFWYANVEVFNSFDYILISDTAPLSRTFLQHIDKLTPKLIIWICNRFDYAMQYEPEYYSLFKSATKNSKVKIVASTFFEKVWCLKNGIDILDAEVITPLGKHTSDVNIPKSNVFVEMYGEPKELPSADVVIPFYRNDNHFFKLADFLRDRDVSVYNGTFHTVDQLKKYTAFVTLPDTFCKWFSFEAIHHNIPVILPSKKLLMEFCKQPDYLFNVTGYGGAEHLTEDLIQLSEWYNPTFADCRYYFDDLEQIPSIISTIKNTVLNFSVISSMYETYIVNKWKALYANF